MNGFELADTAIKIGLGAAISGIATFQVARLNHDRDIEKQALTRRLDSLEKASMAFQQYAHVWRRWRGRLAGVLQEKIPPVDKYTPEQRKRILEIDAEFQKAREHLIVAVAGLHLLGADEALKRLNLFVEEVTALRDKVVFRKEVPTLEYYQEVVDRVIDKKGAFEKSLSALYLKKG